MRPTVLCLVWLATAAPALAPPAFAQLAEERLPACLACHGAAGTSDTPGIPSLGGQLSEYVLIQLYLFREKQRVAEPMNAMAEGLTDDDLRILGDAMAKLPAPVAAAASLDAAGLEHGRGLIAKYRCGSCHSPDFAGHDNIPRLAAQREDYLVKSLTEYKSNARAAYDPSMNEVAQEVNEADIPAIAKYLANYR